MGMRFPTQPGLKRSPLTRFNFKTGDAALFSEP
jgi:hypothetical protein